MKVTRRDFFKSLAASALVAGATLPVGFPTERPKWVEVPGVDWYEGVFKSNALNGYDRDAYFRAPIYDASKDVYLLPNRPMGNHMDQVWAERVRDDVVAAMKRHGFPA